MTHYFHEKKKNAKAEAFRVVLLAQANSAVTNTLAIRAILKARVTAAREIIAARERAARRARVVPALNQQFPQLRWSPPRNYKR